MKTSTTNTTTKREENTMNTQYIIDGLTEELGNNVEVKFVEVPKNNTMRKGIQIREENSNVGATFYFKEEDSEDEIIENTLKAYWQSGKPDFDVSNISDIVTNWDKVKGLIVPCLFNKDRSVFGDDIVTADFVSDIGILFRIVLNSGTAGVASIKVTKAIFDKWDVSVNDMLAVAKENIKEQVYIKDMLTVLLELKGFVDIPEIDTTSLMNVMGIASNVDGAAAVLVLPMLIEEGKVENKDYFIIPSSVHEVILINPDQIETETLNGLIRDVNNEVVKVEDFLSNYALKFSNGIFGVA